MPKKSPPLPSPKSQSASDEFPASDQVGHGEVFVAAASSSSPKRSARKSRKTSSATTALISSKLPDPTPLQYRPDAQWLTDLNADCARAAVEWLRGLDLGRPIKSLTKQELADLSGAGTARWIVRVAEKIAAHDPNAAVAKELLYSSFEVPENISDMADIFL